MAVQSSSVKNIAIGLSKSLADEGNKLGFSRYHDSLAPKKKDSTPILGSAMVDVNQDNKRRCLEKLVVRREPMTQHNVEDVNCALEVEVIDDTALIEVTAAVTRSKNRHRNETDPSSGNNPGNTGGSRNPKEENDGKKKINKGFKKLVKGCSMKCLNEKKLNTQAVEDKSTSKKQIPESKGHKAYRKTSATVKYAYRKKDTKNPKSAVTGVEEPQELENQNVLEKIVDETIQEPDMNEKESAIKLLDAETVNEKEDGLNLNPKLDVLVNTDADDENASASTNVGSKKSAYTRAEMEALRFVDEDGQKTKWTEVYNGFASHVAREYTGLVVDVSNRQPRYKRVVNCGPILSMPPVLPLCSPSSYRKFDRAGVRVSFN